MKNDVKPVADLLLPQSLPGQEKLGSTSESLVGSDQKILWQESTSDSVVASKDTLQLAQEGPRHQRKTSGTTEEDRTTWQGRLRPRRGSVDSLEKPKRPRGQPVGIVKHSGKKLPQKTRQAATKSRSATIAGKTNTLQLSGNNACADKASVRPKPSRVTRS